MEVLYEDNHLIIVNKNCSEIVQGDKTGDTPLSEMLKAWLKEKYNKPGNVFVGVTSSARPSGERVGSVCQDEQGTGEIERYVS